MLFIKIANEYNKISESRSEAFFNLYRKIGDLIGILPIQKDLKNNIRLVLTTNPIKDSDWKIYNKLNPNAKVGFLSRKLMKIARDLNVNQIAIKEFVNAKKRWSFSKKYYYNDLNTIEGKRKIENSLDKLYKDGKITDFKEIIIDEEKHNTTHKNMWLKTNLLIDFILDKTCEKIFNEVNDERYKKIT